VVPVDEPAVAAARADHLSLKFGAVAPAIAAPAVGVVAPAYNGYAAAYGYAGPLNLNTHLVAHPNGAVVPADEPAVAAARADHLAAQGSVYAAAVPAIAAAPIAAVPAYNGYVAAYGYAGPLNLNTHLVAHPNGAVVPADEPAVAAARADHLAAQGSAYAAAVPAIAAAPIAHAGYAAVPAYNGYAAAYGYAGPLNLNTHLVAHPNGAVVPADEPAVAAARADHFAAQGSAYVAAGPAVAAPIALGGVYAGHGYAPYAGLVAHPNGAVVPVDEPAVQAARADHLAILGSTIH